MEDKKFQTNSDPPEQRRPSQIHDEEMEREIQDLERVIEEGNKLLGFPPLPPWEG